MQPSSWRAPTSPGAEGASGSGSPPQPAPAEPPHSPVADAWLAFLERRRALVLALIALVLLAAAGGVPRLQVAGNYEVYFDETNPRLEALNALHARFSRNDNVLFALVPEGGNAFSPATLAAAATLTAQAWHLPYAARVDSVTNYQHITSTEDGIAIGDLVPDPAALDEETAAQVRATALHQPALVRRLVAPSGQVIGVNVRLALGDDSRSEVLEAAAAARELAASIEGEHPGLRVLLTGNAMLNAAFSEASIRDLTHLTPFMYLAIGLGLWLLLRSAGAALQAMTVVALASLFAMGMAGWLGLPVSSGSVVAPTIVTTVAVADCIHLLASFLGPRSRGVPTRECVRQSLGLNLRPVAITSLTTAVGFLSLNFSDAPPFRDLGNITALGVAAAFAMSVALLPIMMLVLPPRPGRPPRLRLDALGASIIARRRMAFAAVLVVTAAGAALLPRMQLNDAFVEYFDESLSFRRDTDLVMATLTGIYQVDYVLEAGAAHGVNAPEYLEGVRRFAAWLRMQPEVMHVADITEVLTRLNGHLAGERDALPSSRDQAAQYLLLYEMSVPYGLDLNDRLDVEREASRVTVTLRNLDNASLQAFEARAAAWMEANLAPQLHAPAVGASVMFAYIAERNIRAMLRGAALAVVVIAALLAVVLRSVRLGLLSLLPNLVPAVIAFGVWALTVGQMGVALAVVAAMSLGVVVDDTVHFTSSFLAARRRLRLGPDAAVAHAFARTGTALASTSLVLVLGFGVLSMSAFEVNHGMGQLSALVIACALVADLLMLPQLLAFAARRGWC